MKIRSLKLREAHKGTHNGRVECFCSILWDREAKYIVTASSSDRSILIHDSLLPTNTPITISHHRDGVTALALNPNSTCLASGSMDHSVKFYKFPNGDFQTNITRFILPIRSLDFNKSGSMVAAAGDDDGIKLINTTDDKIARLLRGHKGSISCIAFDPVGEYLASVDSTGTVIIWDLNSGSTIHVLKGIAPDIGSDRTLINVVCWSPGGEKFSVPARRNDVVLFDRDTAEKVFSLSGVHERPVCFLSWSPNGKYMATSSLDKQVIIWDVDGREDIDRMKFDDRISCMAWKPTGNALAVIDVMGKYSVWYDLVPSSMESPTENIPKSKNSNGLLFDENQTSASGSLSDIGGHSHGESGPRSHKRLHKKTVLDDYLTDDDARSHRRLHKKTVHDEYLTDDDEDLGFLQKSSSKKSASRTQKDKINNSKEESSMTVAITAKPMMQEAFQSGSTPVQTGKQYFLCYNMFGCITTMERDGYHHIEIDIHDTSKGPRIPSMTDHFGFTMASLNENGCIFANPCRGEKNMSTLLYRPFSSWANNSEWTMRFEEEVKVVALGSGWVAAITSLNFLRIFSDSGLQKYVISLDGPVVTASGFNDELAVVTHASPSLPSNEQMLDFRMFNFHEGGAQSVRGRLPLTPGSCLTWLGFSEEGQLASYDSEGVLRVFSEKFGGTWHPIFSPSKEKGSAGEKYWMVGLNNDTLFCISCMPPDLFPQVSPKPFFTMLPFAVPLASSDLRVETLENELILKNMHLSKVQKIIDEQSEAGMDTSLHEDEIFEIRKAIDKCILRFIASCCNGDKLVRATDLVKLLIFEKSVMGAITLATKLKLPSLAERFNNILEERVRNESDGTQLPQAPLCNGNKLEECGATPTPPPKAVDSIPEKPAEVKTTPNFLTSMLLKKRKAADQNDTNKDQNDTNKDQNVDIAPTPPPANPFAKSSTNQHKSTFLDSIKRNKMEF